VSRTTAAAAAEAGHSFQHSSIAFIHWDAEFAVNENKISTFSQKNYQLLPNQLIQN